jgi:hypothetical protein
VLLRHIIGALVGGHLHPAHPTAAALCGHSAEGGAAANTPGTPLPAAATSAAAGPLSLAVASPLSGAEVSCMAAAAVDAIARLFWELGQRAPRFYVKHQDKWVGLPDLCTHAVSEQYLACD